MAAGFKAFIPLCMDFFGTLYMDSHHLVVDYDDHFQHVEAVEDFGCIGGKKHKKHCAWGCIKNDFISVLVVVLHIQTVCQKTNTNYYEYDGSKISLFDHIIINE